MAKQKQLPMPSLEDIQKEMQRVRGRFRYRQALKGTLGTIVVVAALAVLVASLLLPVLRITGTSMQPEFQPGDIVVGYRTSNYKPGDVVSFYFNNKLIIKRVIALGGDRVEIDEETGVVKVNGLALEEPYVSEYAFAPCDLEFPYYVPQDHLFVMGDNRPISADSRVQDFGCVDSQETVGKIFLRLWPVDGLAFYGF
jgi:signal peptidase I